MEKELDFIDYMYYKIATWEGEITEKQMNTWGEQWIDENVTESDPFQFKRDLISEFIPIWQEFYPDKDFSNYMPDEYEDEEDEMHEKRERGEI